MLLPVASLRFRYYVMFLLLVATCWYAISHWSPSVAAQSCAVPAFRQVNSYSESGNGDLAVGDFNRDGYQDLVVVHQTQQRFALWLGNGSGALTRGFTQATDFPLMRVHTGDFNGDGRLDLLTIEAGSFSPSDQLTVWLGSGTGTFTRDARTIHPEKLDYLGNYLQLALADFNNDGRTDFALGNNRTAQDFRLYLSSNAGVLRGDVVGRLSQNALLLAGDVNIDGAFDLIIGQYDPGRILVAYNRGNSTFGAPTEVFRTRSRITGLAFTDFDRTGRRDFVLTTGFRNVDETEAIDSFRLIAVLSDGAGRYTTRSQNLLNLGYPLKQLVDLNADLRPDIVTGYVSENNDYLGANKVIVNSVNQQLCVETEPISLVGARVFADFNNDRRADLVKRDANGFTVWLNRQPGAEPNTPPRITPGSPIVMRQGEQVFQSAIATVQDTENPWHELSAEVDSVPPGLTVTGLRINFENKLVGTFTLARDIPVGSILLRYKITDPAVATTIATATIQALANAPPIIRVPDTPLVVREGLPSVVAVRLSSGGSGGTVFFTNYFIDLHDELTFDLKFSVSASAGVNLSRRQMATLDYTTYYLITATPGTHELRIQVTDSGGLMTQQTIPFTVIGETGACRYPTFAPVKTYELGKTLAALATGDFNGDGKGDVAVTDSAMAQTRIYLGQNSGDLQAGATLLAYAGTKKLFADDFTRDGKLDLAISHANGLALLAGDGTGAFTLRQNYAIGDQAITTGDYNNDNATDFAFISGASSQAALRVFLNDGRGSFTERAQSLAPGSEWVQTVERSSLITCCTGTGNQSLYATTWNRIPIIKLAGQGDGTFRGESPRSFATALFASRIFVGEFVENSKSSLAYDLSRDTFADDRPVYRVDEDFIQLPSQPIYGFKPQALATADFTRDGKPDVVFDSGHLAVSNPTGGYCAMPRLSALGNNFRPAAADINGDGRPDLLATMDNGGLRVFLNRTNTAATVSAASYLGDTLALEQIAAVFGANLAPSTQTAHTVPLPSTLAGTQVRVTDSAGQARFAPLIFVSSGQVNFMIPVGVATGTAKIEIINETGAYSAGAAQIARIAPGLFAANANGQGIAAALVLRVKANGAQIYDEIARFDTTQNKYVPIPIDLSDASDQVFLILFGTGMRGRASLAGATAAIGGANAEVLYVGAQGSLVGLDQINVRIPRSLLGRGEVNVALSVDGIAANVVTISVK